MHDEDHLPVEPRAEEWRDHILGLPHDVPPEQAAHDATPLSDLERSEYDEVTRKLLSSPGIEHKVIIDGEADTDERTGEE